MNSFMLARSYRVLAADMFDYKCSSYPGKPRFLMFFDVLGHFVSCSFWDKPLALHNVWENSLIYSLSRVVKDFFMRLSSEPIANAM